MSPEIWQDLLTRMKNLRADLIGQWQGDIDNRALEVAVGSIGAAIQVMQTARPEAPAPKATLPSSTPAAPGGA